MDLVNIIILAISAIATGVAAYALVSINRTLRRAHTAESADAGKPIQAASTGIAVSQNRLGGAGAVELRRGNRLDLFGSLLDTPFGPPGIVDVPPNPFDLSPADEAAADQLKAALVAPSFVQPFRPFSIGWQVQGPSSALARVNSYQVNVSSFGPIFGLSPEATLTPEGLKAQGSVTASMWKSGSIRLWARFGSGIRELVVKEVTVDRSDCSEERVPLAVAALLFQTDGATRFVEAVQEEAGEDVTVTVLTNALATYSSDGFTFTIKLKLEGSGATIVVDLGMQFAVVPRAGHLGASFSSPGYRSVDIDADLPWYDDLWHKITLGKHNLSSYYAVFGDGLKQLADGFAAALGRQARGLPDPDDPDYDDKEAKAPKAVATAMDITNDDLVVTLCPIPSQLVPVSGIFPASAIQVDVP